MAEIIQRPHVEVSATMKFSEIELRALDALVGYGVKPFLEVFYAKMGKHYMQPHEEGLRTLFSSISSVVPGILARTDDARRVFTGERIAAHRPPVQMPKVIGQDAGIDAAMLVARREG